MALPVILDHLSKTYDGRTVLDDISVPLQPGSINALLGPNGAGKTTLIGCLLGLLTPDGSVWVRGWRPELDGLNLPVLSGDMEAYFLALTR